MQGKIGRCQIPLRPCQPCWRDSWSTNFITMFYVQCLRKKQKPPAFPGIRRGSLPGCAVGEQSRVCGTGRTSGLYLSFHVLEVGHYLYREKSTPLILPRSSNQASSLTGGCAILSAPLCTSRMASFGQVLTHRPQPIHLSRIIR